jgi:predicted RNA methylase
VNSPDNSTTGLLECAPDPQRYENPNRDPDEVAVKIASYVPRGSRVLDVGCGTGCNSEVVALDCGVTLIGIEPDVIRWLI